LFGVHNLSLAEDVVQDAFCRAMRVWPFRGVPENPSAWLVRAIPDADRLTSYPFYHAAFGEFELRAGRHQLAADYFLAARQLARNPTEQQFFEQRIRACNRAASSEKHP
jgi:predicted RNA polymerase sigma factor